MRIASIGHAVFSATMIGLGIVGLLHRDFVPVWNPVPASVPARELFLYLGALIAATLLNERGLKSNNRTEGHLSGKPTIGNSEIAMSGFAIKLPRWRLYGHLG